jgi:hypothetical protein
MWKELGGQEPVRILSTVKEAVEFVDANYTGARVIVAGSTYLVGTVHYLVNVGESS